MKMDYDMATAVLSRWQDGEAVYESAIYKAAEALGADPQAALVEARFYTYLDNFLLEKRAMSDAERLLFSYASGFNSRPFIKTASMYGISPDDLIIEALVERNFVPDLEKIALIASPQETSKENTPEDSALPASVEGTMTQPPQRGALVQQQPSARIRPSPTAPEQVAPSDTGNIEELLAMAQQNNPQAAESGGGIAPSGAPSDPPQPLDSLSRVMQVGPNLDQETAGRYAEQLDRFEQGFGMQISDPKQMIKFVKELQKLDGKKIDQGIKAMSQQLEQEQAQELGIDGGTPTIDGGGGPQVLAPKQAKNPLAGKEPTAQNQPPIQQSASEKVAYVAQFLARTSCYSK